jgi:hypothetical protein
MGHHRPIDERMEALQAQMISLQAKANKAELAQDPKVQAIDAKIAEENKDALKWKRWSKDSETKVEAFEARVAEWLERGEKADSWLASHKERMTILKSDKEQVISDILSN